MMMTDRDIADRLREAKAFMAGARGPFILHLSDTLTEQYPFAAALLETVRPQLTVHTGDMADEFKVGRVPGDVPGYRAALPALLSAMERCSARVVCTPGNNDDFSVLAGHPNITVVENGARIEELGVRMELNHVAIPATWGVDFALYGHGPTDDMRYPLPDEPDAPVYLNGNYHWTIIDAPTKRFCRLRCRPDAPCMRLLIARHAHVRAAEYADGEHVPARVDPPISALGERQARFLAQEVRRLRFRGRLIASPFTRTLMTARPISWAIGAPIHLAADFREIVKSTESLKGFEGKTLARIKSEFPEVAPDAQLPWPWWAAREETMEDVTARVAPLIDGLLARGENAMLIGHGASTTAAVRYLLGKSGFEFGSYFSMPRCANCSLSEFRLVNGKLRPVRIFSAGHIPLTMLSASAMMALERKGDAQ